MVFKAIRSRPINTDQLFQISQSRIESYDHPSLHQFQVSTFWGVTFESIFQFSSKIFNLWIGRVNRFTTPH